jgi:hypothetical protein
MTYIGLTLVMTYIGLSPVMTPTSVYSCHICYIGLALVMNLTPVKYLIPVINLTAVINTVLAKILFRDVHLNT